MKKVITPSIGRHVLFQLDKNSPEQAAIIAAVHGDTCVNLAIFDGNGKPMAGPPTSITLVQPGEEAPAAGYFCKWMPYTIEQAEADVVSPPAIDPSNVGSDSADGGVGGTQAAQGSGAQGTGSGSGDSQASGQPGANGGQHAAPKTDGAEKEAAPAGT